MKRSGDVTASAIILVCGSGLAILMALLMLLAFTTTQLPPEQRAVEFIIPIVYALLAAWGIATGVGILRLRPWARISIIVMSSLTIFFVVCGALGLMLVPMLLSQNPEIPAAAARMAVLVGIATMLVPLAVAIWWVVLFTRKRVVLEFATHGAAAVSTIESDAVLAGTALPLAISAPTRPPIPTSIRVIAIIVVACAPFALVSLPLAIRAHLPTIILGFWMTGWAAPAYLVISVAIQIVFSIAILRRRFRALDGLIAYLLFAVLNALLFVISPARNAFFDVITRTQTSTPGMDPEIMVRFMKTAMPIMVALSVLLFAVALYFLFTRRKAFREACDARREARKLRA